MSCFDSKKRGALSACTGPAGLTLRERQVAQYITQGRSNKYIALELGVSQRTIEAHRARVFAKMGVRNAVELTSRWISQGQRLLAADHFGQAPYFQAPACIARFNLPGTAVPACQLTRQWGQDLPGG
ncbi:helix-turn-helix transcriptional regulator [Castellaniella sp. FW104-16D08]|jgi:DNA-binding CsgD family transcriptional regulator|uniref:response regulator transcription factor n=1 Tax=unclassified Castellaniella TaxID=2617606 RepID=UPI003315C8F7